MSKKNVVLWVALFLAGVVSFWASAFPDGLESVAGKLGFMERAVPSRGLIFADYSLPFIRHATLASALAGVLGVGLCVGIIYLVGKVYFKLQDRSITHSSVE